MQRGIWLNWRYRSREGQLGSVYAPQHRGDSAKSQVVPFCVLWSVCMCEIDSSKRVLLDVCCHWWRCIPRVLNITTAAFAAAANVWMNCSCCCSFSLSQSSCAERALSLTESAERAINFCCCYSVCLSSRVGDSSNSSSALPESCLPFQAVIRPSKHLTTTHWSLQKEIEKCHSYLDRWLPECSGVLPPSPKSVVSSGWLFDI